MAVAAPEVEASVQDVSSIFSQFIQNMDTKFINFTSKIGNQNQSEDSGFLYLAFT